jgi:hypothetical protein
MESHDKWQEYYEAVERKALSLAEPTDVSGAT